MEAKVVYFEKPGKENTAEVLRLAKERAQERGIKKVVLASTRGDTARVAADFFAGTGVQLIVVPHQFGFGEREQRFPQALVSELRGKGHHVHFATMLFHTDSFYGTSTPRIMATLLRIFCPGIKVCVEMTLMVCDGGLVASGEMVIAVAGTVAGADTAVVVTAASTHKLADLRIHELICKPL